MRSVVVVMLAGALALAACSGSPEAVPSVGEVEEGRAGSAGADESGRGTEWRPFDKSALGWELCPEPVQVIPWFSPKSDIFVGSNAHIAKVNQKLGEALYEALGLWSKATGLTFQPAPMADMRIDPDTGLALPADGSYTPRSIIVSLISEQEAAMIDGSTVGLATRIHEQQSNGLIDAATAAYDSDYLRTASHDQLVNLFAHEIGHALGLGHSPAKGNIMFAEVSDQTKLGPGDIAGIRALTRPCSN
jgi:hypothetical protein